jgi:hypothetical protein
VSSVDLTFDERAVGAVPNRIIAAAGPLANLVAGGIVILLADRIPLTAPVTRYAAWLFGHVSLFVAGGYGLALSFADFGDMHAIVRGLAAPVVWQIVLTLIGLAISFYALVHGVRRLMPFLGDGPDRVRRSVRLTIVPYHIALAPGLPR